MHQREDGADGSQVWQKIGEKKTIIYCIYTAQNRFGLNYSTNSVFFSAFLLFSMKLVFLGELPSFSLLGSATQKLSPTASINE